LWKSILYSAGFNSLYEEIKENNIKNFIETNKEVDGVIGLDVEKSFTNSCEENTESIRGGIYKGGATVFTMLSTPIDNFHLSNLFRHDLPLL